MDLYFRHDRPHHVPPLPYLLPSQTQASNYPLPSSTISTANATKAAASASKQPPTPISAPSKMLSADSASSATTNTSSSCRSTRSSQATVCPQSHSHQTYKKQLTSSLYHAAPFDDETNVVTVPRHWRAGRKALRHREHMSGTRYPHHAEHCRLQPQLG